MNTITLPNGAIAFPAMEQGTPEWLAARAGVATASRFKDVLTKPREKGAVWSKTALTYAYELAGEIITGAPAESVETFSMRRGKEMEAGLRDQYAFISDAEVVEVGFVRRGRYGASPDGLVGTNGLVEFKSHLPKILIPMLLNGDEVPDEHRAQVQGQLLATGREWNELFAFWPGLPPLNPRVYRDEPFISDLEKRLEDFAGLVDDVVERVRAYGTPTAIAAE
ncbi:MAG: lambda exonuclease family protein [Alkalilacustris sp.]